MIFNKPPLSEMIPQSIICVSILSLQSDKLLWNTVLHLMNKPSIKTSDVCIVRVFRSMFLVSIDIILLLLICASI